MAQHHLEHLTSVDASLLHHEDGPAHMHIGGVARFDGPPPAFGDFLDRVRSRLPLVPRYRQKLATPPAALGRPRWIDDPTFALEYHVRHVALPAPGDETTLRTFVARMFSRRLDRGRPLWELWLVEGLPDLGFATVSKTHLAVVDGVSGADLLTTLFDVPSDANGEGTAGGRPLAPRDVWEPRPVPSPAQLAADALGGATRIALGLPLRVAHAAARPGEALHAAREAVATVGEAAAAQLAPGASQSPLDVPIGAHRRLAFADVPLAALKAIKDAFGGTVNDVVLAVTAGGVRRWMQHRGLSTDDPVLTAGVPVSMYAPPEADSVGSRVTLVVAPLPVGVADPVQRLREVSAATAGLKASGQARGASALASAQGFAPPTMLAEASRLNPPSRLCDLLVANVPGPQVGLTMLGRRMRDVHPVPILSGDRSLGVAVMSYDGTVGFGLLGDFDALPDVDVVARGVRDAVAELAGLARASG